MEDSRFQTTVADLAEVNCLESDRWDQRRETKPIMSNLILQVETMRGSR